MGSSDDAPPEYDYIEFEHGSFHDIPTHLIRLLPTKSSLASSSSVNPKVFCDVRKFSNLPTPTKLDDPALQNCDSQIIVSQCLPVGSIFDNKITMIKLAIGICRKARFMLSECNQMKLKCNYKQCKFAINYTALFKRPPDDTPAAKKRRKRVNRENIFTGPVAITSITNDHNHQCTMSNLLQAAQASGVHLKRVHKDKLWMLVGMMRNDPCLHARSIRSVLEIAGPKSKQWTCKDIASVRVKVKNLLMKQHIETDLDERQFIQQFTDEDYEKFFNEECEYYADHSTFYAAEILSDIFGNRDENDPNDKTTCTLIQYLELLQKSDDSFDYRTVSDNDEQIIGIAYQTGAMRAAFDLFGENISLDAMKKALNTSNYPYFAATVIRDDGMIDIALEAIVHKENIFAYQFLMKSMLDMAHKRTSDQIYVITGDDFINQNMVTNDFDLPNAKFMADYYHLNESIWPNNFRAHIWDAIKTNIKSMLDAKDESNFNHAAMSANSILILNRASSKEIAYMASIVKRGPEYSLYHVQRTKGSLCRRGSQRSECQHSIISKNLGKHYYKPIYNMIQDLQTIGLMRQEKHRRQLLKDNSCLRVIHHELSNQVKKTDSSIILYEASKMILGKSLGLAGYDLLKNELSSIQLLSTERDVDGSLSIRHVCGSNKGVKRNFKDANSRCSRCTTSTTMMSMCYHELRNRIELLSIDEVFDISFFGERYHYRECPPLTPRNDVISNSDIEIQPSSILARSEYLQNISNPRKEVLLNNNHDGNGCSSECISPPVYDNSTVLGNRNASIDTSTDPLGYKKLLDISNRVVSAVSNLGSAEQLQFAGLLLAVEDMTTYGKNIHFNTQLQNLYNNLEGAPPQFDQGRSRTSNRLMLPQTQSPKEMVPQYHMGLPKNRPKTMREKIQDKVKKKHSDTRNDYSKHSVKDNIITKPKCSFCQGGHPGFAKKCPLKLQYGDGIVDFDAFTRDILSNHPISINTKVVNFDSSDRDVFQQPKYHFVINSIHHKYRPHDHFHGTDSLPQDLVLNVTLLHRHGPLGVRGTHFQTNVGIGAKTLFDRMERFPSNHFIFDMVQTTSVGQNFTKRMKIATTIHQPQMLPYQYPYPHATHIPFYHDSQYRNGLPNMYNTSSDACLLYPQMPVNYQNRPLNTTIDHIQNHNNNMNFRSASQHQIQGYHGTAPAEAVVNHAPNSYNNEVLNCNNHHTQGTIAVGTAIKSQSQWDSHEKSENTSAENGREDRLK